MPGDLRQQLEGAIKESSRLVDSSTMERLRAERIALITARVYAPHVLRRAGHHDHADRCETAIEVADASRISSLVQHSIGVAHRDLFLTGYPLCAYGVVAQAANAFVAATSPEDRWIPDAGDRAASALLSLEEAGESEQTEICWVWSAAVGTIASCMSAV
jgi:hypothetical protein